jgi:hypothetical protein
MRSAIGDSSKLSSRKPDVKVSTLLAGRCSSIEATMVEESMPPLRNAPSGTSLTRRWRTASSIRARSSSAAASSDANERLSLNLAARFQ